MRILIVFALISTVLPLEFNCKYEMRTYSPYGNQLACHIYSPRSFENNETVTSVNPLTGSSLDDVRSLDVWYHPGVHRLPKNIEKFFPNLIIISWYNSVMKSVTAEDLKPFPNLIWLSFQVNQIETLDGDLFKHTKNLECVNFSQNRLTRIGDGMLADLPNLKLANFRLNTCYNTASYEPAGIKAMKINIPSLCDGSTTTISTTTQQSDQCSDGCAERIKKLEKLLEMQGKNIERNEKVIVEQTQAIAEVEEKLRRIASIFQ
jgi:uncharacterized coiled-coil protein SlyX